MATRLPVEEADKLDRYAAAIDKSISEVIKDWVTPRLQEIDIDKVEGQAAFHLET